MAVLFYNALQHGMQYKDPRATYYEDHYSQRVLEDLRRRAATLGYVLQDQTMSTGGQQLRNAARCGIELTHTRREADRKLQRHHVSE